MENVIAAFSLPQVERLTDLTQSQLIDWDNSDFFRPSLAYDNRRSPYSRVYSFEDVVGLRTLAILRDRVSMQHLREAADCLKAHSGKPWSQLELYTLNGEVHFKRPGEAVIEGAVSGQYGATIPIESIAEEMRDKANELRKRDPSKIGTIEQSKFVMGNAPVFGGTRILVASVKEFLEAGYSQKAILAEFPDLKRADIEAARKIQDGLTRAA